MLPERERLEEFHSGVPKMKFTYILVTKVQIQMLPILQQFYILIIYIPKVEKYN